MLVLLPIEVWMAILDWLRKDRSKLAIKFSQLGDRTFSEFYQHWFHKYTKNVQLGKLLITSVKEFNNCGDIVRRAQLHSCWEVKKDGKMVEETEVMVPFAQVPLPENIRAIKEVEIRFLDSEVLTFLRKLLALFTMSKIELNLMSTGEPEVAEILGHFMSLLNGVRINQIYFKRGTGHYSLLDLFPAQMSGVKILNFTDYYNEHLALQVSHWLSTKRADAEPRVFLGSHVGCRQLFDIITKQFLAATLPVSFFICVCYYVRFEPINVIPESRVENGATGEQLIVRLKQVRQRLQKVLIGRCPANADGNSWLQKMEQKLVRIWDQAGPKLCLHKPQLGQMQTDEAEALANADNNDDADKPGPSKKRRLTLEAN